MPLIRAYPSTKGRLERKPFREIKDGVIHFNGNPAQDLVMTSPRRFIWLLAGTQSGKTIIMPVWLEREISKTYREEDDFNDYIVATSTFPLLNKKLLPVFKEYFIDLRHHGKYSEYQKILQFDNSNVRIIFGSADNPESLESATAKAAVIDEGGQNQFRRETYEAILRRLSLFQGRIYGGTCYDDKTEIYTANGWKLIGTLTDEDEVYAPDEYGRGKFEKPYARTWELYTGKMLHFTGGRIDLCVTPHHRILYKKDSRFYIKDAEHFRKLNRRSLVIPKIISPDITEQTEFILPTVDRNHRWVGGTRASREIKIPMPDWCAFMGWFLSEGYVTGTQGGSIGNGKYHIVITQQDEAKRQLIWQDLNKLPFKWREEGVKFITGNKQLWSYLKSFGDCYHKSIPTELKHSGKENLLILIDRMIQGDGANGESGFRYYTTSSRLAEDFREVCMLVGISTGFAIHDNHGGFAHPHPIYHIWQRKRKGGLCQDCEELDYDGYVGCVGTSTGLVLVRRSGEECLSGNTLYNWGWLKTEIYDRCLAGDPNIDIIQADSLVNPFFPKEEYDRAQQTMPRWKFDLFYRGVFTRPAGMVYDSFDEKMCKISRFAIPKEWPRFIGHDFGGVNTVALWYACDPSTGYFYLYRTYKEGGKTARTHTEAWKRLSEGETIIKRVGGAKSEDQWRQEFTQQGWPIQQPKISDPQVQIDRVYALHSTNRLYVFSDLTDYLDEKAAYSYQLDDNYNPTGKIEDEASFHYMAAERYIMSDFVPEKNISDVPQVVRYGPYGIKTKGEKWHRLSNATFAKS